MELIIKVIAVSIGGYLLGSLNMSLIIGKLYKVDIRKFGSGNAGATNTLRTLGKTAAILVSLGDVLKGIVASLLGMLIVGEIEGVGYLGLMTAGLCSILGHNWPVYFNFNGGKGVLTSLAVLFMMDWRIAIILLIIFTIIFVSTRYISLGSVIGAACFPLVSLIPYFEKSIVFTLFSAIISLLIIVRHHSNIKRLINGSESKTWGR